MIKGTLKLHQVARISPSQVDFYYNSTYKNVSPMLRSVNYDERSQASSEGK